MYDLERISKILADLEKYFRDLDYFKVESATMSTEQFYGLSMLLFAMLNRTIDLGKEIIRGQKLGMPASYREIFQIMEKEKSISSELSQRLQQLTNQRKVLAQEYFDVTEQSIYSIYLRINVIKEFMRIARELIVNKKNTLKNKKETDYYKRLEEIKERSPRAYEPWKLGEENILKNLYSENKTINEIARILKRQPNAIRSRLNKLGILP